jgi:hypothetical protein
MVVIVKRHLRIGRKRMTNASTGRLTTLILWAIAWAVAMIASAILLKGNPVKDWIQAALFIGAMTFWVWQSIRASGKWRWPEGYGAGDKSSFQVRLWGHWRVMKGPASMKRSLLVKVIIAALAFILGFSAHMVWIRRQQIIDVWNNIFLYYQDWSGPHEGVAERDSDS